MSSWLTKYSEIYKVRNRRVFRVRDDSMETVPTQEQRFAQPHARTNPDGSPIPVQPFSLWTQFIILGRHLLLSVHTL